jgi:tetratricopeptide (TPR) repeat protein
LEEALALAPFRASGNKQGVAWTVHHLSSVVAATGEWLLAKSLQEESLSIQREQGNGVGIAWSLDGLGRLHSAAGDAPAARAYLQESLRIHAALGVRRGIASSLEGLATVLLAQSEPGTAARILAAAAGIRKEIRAPIPPSERDGYEATVEAARRALGQDRFARAWEEGWTQPLDRIVAVALGPTT